MATTPERPLNELYGATNTREINTDLWNGLIREVQNRLAKLEILRDGLEGVLAQSQTIALDRINEVLTPAIEQINADLETLAGMIETAQADLHDATEGALASIQPQIDAKLAAVDVALAALASAVSAAGAATTDANAAAAAANAAAAGVAAAIASALATTQAQARRQAIAFAVAL